MPAMDQKGVIEQLKLLQKAVAEKQPSENVKAILQKLKDDVVATEELLRVSLPWLLTAVAVAQPHLNRTRCRREAVMKHY